MFLDIGHAVINADRIARVEDTVPDRDGNRAVKITMLDGSVRTATLDFENVRAQLASCVIPAPADSWMIVANEGRPEDDVVELDFTSLQIIAFRLDHRYAMTTPIGVIGVVDEDSAYCILQPDNSVIDINGEYQSSEAWKAEIARQISVEGKTVRRLDIKERT